MYYIIYIFGIILFLLKGIGFSQLSSFRDSITLLLVLAPCFIMLLCTKSFKSFGECFLFTFGKRNYSLLQCKMCLLSVKMVFLTSAMSGLICFMISMVNMMRFSNSLKLVDLSVALLPLFYVLIIGILLLPLHVMLKQHMMNLVHEADK